MPYISLSQWPESTDYIVYILFNFSHSGHDICANNGTKQKCQSTDQVQICRWNTEQTKHTQNGHSLQECWTRRQTDVPVTKSPEPTNMQHDSWQHKQDVTIATRQPKEF